MQIRIFRTLTAVAAATGVVLGVTSTAEADAPPVDSPWQLHSTGWSEPTRVSIADLGFAGLQVAPDGYATTAFREGGTDAAPVWAAYERKLGGQWTKLTDGTVAEQTEFADDSKGWRIWSTVEDGQRRHRLQQRPIGGSFGPGSELVPATQVTEGDTWVHDDFLLARNRSAPAVLSVSTIPSGGYRTGLLYRDYNGEWNQNLSFRTTEGDPAFYATHEPYGDSSPRLTRAAWLRPTATGQELVTSGVKSDLSWAADVATPIATPAPVTAVSWAGESTVLLWMDAARTRVAAVTLDVMGRPGPVIDLGTVLPGTGGVHTVYSKRARQDALVWVTGDHRLMRTTVRVGETPSVSEVATGVSHADVAADSRGNVLMAWSSTADAKVHYVLDWLGADESPDLTLPGIEVGGGDLAVGAVDVNKDAAFTLLTDNGYSLDLAIPVSVTRVRPTSATRWLPNTRLGYRADAAWTLPKSYDVRGWVTRPSSPYREPENLRFVAPAQGTFHAEAGATYCLQGRTHGILGYDLRGSWSPWGARSSCVTAPYPVRKLQRHGAWTAQNGALVSTRQGAKLTWRAVFETREVALRVRPTHGRVTVTLGGRVVGTKRLDHRVVRIGSLKKLVDRGKLVIEVTSKGKPVRIESVYLTR